MLVVCCANGHSVFGTVPESQKPTCAISLWAKREEQIRGVMEATAGLYGDLQGIAGRSLLEIEGLELSLLRAHRDRGC